MRQITLSEYEKIHPDFRGVFQNYWGEWPEAKGRRTMLDYDDKVGTVLLIEGFSFEITNEVAI